MLNIEVLSSTVDRQGRVMLPAGLRCQLNIREGDRLIVQVEDGRISMMTRKEAIRRAQRFFRSVQPGRSL